MRKSNGPRATLHGAVQQKIWIPYKSYVYSFGMLILKMVLGEKYLLPNLQTDSEVYYPELFMKS
jgi:hypothetical protein